MINMSHTRAFIYRPNNFPTPHVELVINEHSVFAHTKLPFVVIKVLLHPFSYWKALSDSYTRKWLSFGSQKLIDAKKLIQLWWKLQILAMLKELLGLNAMPFRAESHFSYLKVFWTKLHIDLWQKNGNQKFFQFLNFTIILSISNNMNKGVYLT